MKRILETKRLILREMTQNDYDDLAEVLRDSDDRHTLSCKDVQLWLDTQLENYKQSIGLWAMIDKHSGMFVGQCGLTWQDVEGVDELAIDCLLKRKFRDFDYAGEAAIDCLRYANDSLKEGRVVFIICENNDASQRVAEQLGMTVEKTFKKHYCGNVISHYLYVITKYLWHYTSKEVFCEFLKSKSVLYGTHYKFLNDQSEIDHGRNLFNRAMQGIPYLKKYCKDEIADYTRENIPISTDMFIACFSYEEDSLYQWRSYCPNGGFAIGFSIKSIENSVKAKIDELKKKFGNIDQVRTKYPDPHRIYRHHCIYGEDELIRYYMERLEKYLPKSDVEQQGDSYTHSFLKSFCEQDIYVCKNKSFEIEREYRIAHRGPSIRKNIEIIGGKPRVPLFEINRSGIEKIMISPHGEFEQNHLLAELLREQYGLKYEITNSSSSYRG